MIKLFPISAIALAALLGSCQQHGGNHGTRPGENADKVLPPLHLGAVQQVYPEQGFALLRIIGPMPKPGTVLISHPADGTATRVANLVVTSDQPAKNRIIAAEIRSGSLLKGDRVFMYRNIAAPTEQPETEQEPAEIQVPAGLPAAPTPVLPTLPQEEQPPTAAEPTEEPARPQKNTPQHQETPQHILDIPENIEDWD